VSWTELGFEGEPVRGNVDAFVSATAKWKTVNQSAIAVQSEFHNIVAGHVTVGFEGRAAEQFAKVVEEIQGVLDGLPTVSESIRSALDTHRVKLEALRRESDQALARAKVAKAECANASAAQTNSEARAASLKKQIDQLRNVPEPDDAHILSVERLFWSATQERNQRRNATVALQAQVDEQLKKWGELRTSEDSINKQTASNLRSIDLVALRDPGWIEQQLEAFAGFMGELGSDLWQAGAAFARGDVDAALFHLRDAIDKFLIILNVVGLILDVVAVVLAVTGVGLPLAALLFGISKGIRLATLVLAGIKLNAGAVLVGRGASHPDTGAKLGLVDLAFDGVEVGLAALGAGGKAVSLTSGPVKFNVGRDFVKDQIGISFKRGYDVAWKQTSRNVLKITLKGSDFYGDVFSGYQDGDKSVIDATETFARGQGSDGGLWKGTSAQKARCDSIQQGLNDIRAGQPGIVTPVMTNLVSF
jgi:hypothetical protein